MEEAGDSEVREGEVMDAVQIEEARIKTSSKIIRIALAGNPNSGKTTLFNALTGSHHRVGNYPGVTVEKREGYRNYKGYGFLITDLPGIYSLTAYSIDEMIARDFILEEKPDLILDVLDSTNLERNLYLCLQFQELGLPLVAAMNMTDEAKAKGIQIDTDLLSQSLGIPMVKTIGPKGVGVSDLLDTVIAVVEKRNTLKKYPSYGGEIDPLIDSLAESVSGDPHFAPPPRWFAAKLLEKDPAARERAEKHRDKTVLLAQAEEKVAWIEKHFGKKAEIILSDQRYGYIHGAVKEAVRKEPLSKHTLSEKADKILLNRVLGLPIFLLVLWGVFKLTFTLGEYPMLWLESLFAGLTGVLEGLIPPGIIRSLVVDGIIGGVGGVFSFVPLIIILFFCISFLEDTGYISRAAFISDRFLHLFGLHGQSFMPMILGFGCSVPAIMAARTLKSKRDRLITIFIIPFMSCGAKLPVYVLLAAAFFPRNAGNMVMLMYIIGVALALIASLTISKTVLKGKSTPFVMELPPYRLPTLRGVLWHVWEKIWHYVKKAGTVIMFSSLFIWFITTFPAPPPVDSVQVAETGQISAPLTLQEEEPDLLSYSFAGRIGRVLEPVVRPLGFDWKIGVATITGFAAKEVIVSTLGVLYKVGAEETEESESLREAIRQDSTFSPLTALSLMLFILIMPPCFAALATVRAETGWKWLGLMIGFSLTLAWITSFFVYQTGSLILGFL